MDKFLIIFSATTYFAGTYLLSKSIEFQADKLELNDNQLDDAVKKMGSPGRINHPKYRWGMILTGLGYASLLLSLAV